MLEKELKAYASWHNKKKNKRKEKGKRKKNHCPVFLKKMDFKESCNLHILSLSFVWYSCSFYLIMLWGGGVWKSINKCSNYSLTCLRSRPFHRVMFLSEFIFGLSTVSATQNQVLPGHLWEFFFRLAERVFHKKNISISKQGVCLFWKQTYCYFIIIIIIIICYFNGIVFHWKGDISRVWYKPRRRGGIHAFSLFFPQVGPDPLRCCAPSLLHQPRGGASMKYVGAEC